MKPFILIANFKMNPTTLAEVEQYKSVFERELGTQELLATKVILCPPLLYAGAFRNFDERIHLGAQHVFSEKNGAYTGEISPVMLKDFGVEYVLIGHSERRQYFHMSDEDTGVLVNGALKYLLTPILCVGETRAEREKGETETVLQKQLEAVFQGLSKMQAEKIIIAYEPRWAIGTDVLPTTQEIQGVQRFICAFLTERFDEPTVGRMSIVYGGSVQNDILAAVSWEAGMDGVLVGRATLFPYEVVKMIQQAETRNLSNEAHT